MKAEGAVQSGRPFVVTVASEKGGVGKTTIATNLAVYLKALREDLPVTIASFDNHFTVESMFAIAGRRGSSVAALFRGTPPDELLLMGEYGVQFISSDHGLTPPDDDPFRLRQALGCSSISGIVILDTRPVLDYFTTNALFAADLVLVPVKDRPSLMNAASIHRLFAESGADSRRIWLLPSLIDRRLRLRSDVGMADYLTFGARERGYQILDIALSKSPRVEKLTTSFTSRVHPVITHASGTAVHLQLRDLARFVLQRHEAGASAGRETISEKPGLRGRGPRFISACPLCGSEAAAKEGYFYQTLSRRRYGCIHHSCLSPVLGQLTDLPHEAVLLALAAEGEGFAGGERCSWFLYDDSGTRVAEGEEEDSLRATWQLLLEGASATPFSEILRECLLISLDRGVPERFLHGEQKVAFSALRRKVLGDLSVA
jgi:chromosome partitioning protein